MTTAITASPAIPGAPSAAVRRIAIRCAGDLLSAGVAAVVVVAAGGALTAYGAGLLALGWLVVQAPTRRALLDGPREDCVRVLRGTVVAAMACWLADITLPVPAAALAGFVVLATVASLLVRSVHSGASALRTIVLGDADEAAAVGVGLAGATSGRMVAAATCSLDQLAETLQHTTADLVLALAGPSLCDRALQRVGWQLETMGVPLLVTTGLADVAAGRTRVTRVGALDLLHLAPARRRGPATWLKTLWERVAAAALLALIAPILVAVVVAVRLDSPGPAIFRQRRVGQDGTTFTMLKFRTMYVDAPERLAQLRDRCDGMLFKLRDDPRITRCGRLLRRYSLDELPQLVNVVRGEMALVGPRPALPEEVAAYDDDPRHRLVVRPGLTGLWQVSGRSDLSWEETVRLDLDYVDNWSIGRDLAIVARTVGAVLGHRGAY